MKTNVALIIIFNHRYDGNIEKLEFIYSGRFQNRYYLVPFYDGNRSNVIPVYGNSYYFQGYIAQGYKLFFKEEFSHYLFIADDLILNPVINEDNFMDHLKLNENSCFIPELLSLHHEDSECKRLYASGFILKKWGMEALNEIPSYEDAAVAFSRYSLNIQPLKESQIPEKGSLYKKFKAIVKFILRRQKSLDKRYELSYPLVNAFSDIIVITKNSIERFSHYCGMLAASELFVELAIPTAMVLSAEAITIEGDLNLHGKFLHTEEQLKELDRFNFNITDLISDFPDGYLYLHPVKLSKWKI